jgi:fumarylacetoacetate (FAA) hydrolase
MKFATLKDGTFVVVSRDLRLALPADDIAESILEAVQRWPTIENRLVERYRSFDDGTPQGSLAFDPESANCPLPRAPQWLDGSTFQNHGRLMEKAFNLPAADYSVNPMMYQGNSDDFIGPTDDVLVPSESDGADCEGEIGIVVGPVPMGCPRSEALSHVRLLVLINDVSLRAHAAREMKTGFGWIQAKPCTSFGPVAVTPDELASSWRDGRVHLPLRCERNGEWMGHPNGREMTFGFDQLIAYAAYSRPLAAGTVIGSGTFSNADRAAGSVCIAERRAIEMIEFGEPRTPFLRDGERIRLESTDAAGQSMFGAIDQRYVIGNRANPR